MQLVKDKILENIVLGRMLVEVGWEEEGVGDALNCKDSVLRSLCGKRYIRNLSRLKPVLMFGGRFLLGVCSMHA